jgi:acyl-CoA synthetase (AMP-forming)/AMP-acid ligase II
MNTLASIIERNAACYPDREVIVCFDRRISFGTFATRAEHLGSALYDEGLRRFDLVAINKVLL